MISDSIVSTFTKTNTTHIDMEISTLLCKLANKDTLVR